MNAYRWDDLAVGLEHTFETTIAPGAAEAFAALSGDVNPLHVDHEFAVSQGFPGPVIYGMLTSCFYSQLVGVYLPGKFVLLQGIDIDFHAPCFAGDRLTVSGQITFMSEAYRRLEIKASIRKQDGKLASKANIRVGLNDK